MNTNLHGRKTLRVLEIIAHANAIESLGPNWSLVTHMMGGLLHDLLAAKLITPADTPCGYVITERGRQRMLEITVRFALEESP